MEFEERWVEIEDFPRYAVSDQGRVMNRMTNLILIPNIVGRGYLQVKLCNNYNKKYLYIHRLVAFAFVNGYFYDAEVNHIDGDKINNYVENLEWCSPSDNVLHAFRLGLRTSSGPYIRVRCIETGKVFNSINNAAVYFNVHRTAISNVVHGRQKTTRGYSFELVD